jgi:hypothetical protein
MSNIERIVIGVAPVQKFRQSESGPSLREGWNPRPNRGRNDRLVDSIFECRLHRRRRLQSPKHVNGGNRVASQFGRDICRYDG